MDAPTRATNLRQAVHEAGAFALDDALANVLSLIERGASNVMSPMAVLEAIEAALNED